MRRCEDCHTTERAHGFLPRAERHLEQLGCETCHIPRVPGPARSVTDYSYPDPEGKPRIEYRGLQGSMRDERTLVTGYEPLWLRRTEQSGKQRVLPYNVVTTFYWVVDAPEGPLPAPLELLARAFSADSAAGRELRQALDRNRDGALGEDERVLDSEALVKRAEALLAQAGARAPRLVGELQPYGVHHGVAPGREALRECAVCHGAASRFLSAFTLAERAPFGVTPQALPDANVRLPAAPGVDASGRLALSPSAAPAGLHVFGTSRYAWLDWAGMLIAALTFVGATTHGALRARARRRPGADS
jgi:hypothetical protein